MNRGSFFSLTLVACAVVCPLYAEWKEDHLVDAQGTNQYEEADQWGLAAIELESKQHRLLSEDSSRGRTVVAVIDSGLDYQHPDFYPDNLWTNPDENVNGKDDDGNGYIDDVIGWNFLDDNNDPWDNLGHGTHVAGIIAAQSGNGSGIKGMDSRALIMPLKVLNNAGRGLSTRIAQAVYYAVDKGAQVINMSMATEDTSEHESKAIEYAVSKGVLVVVASGNEGKDAASFTPASLPGVITVAATDRTGNRPNYSNWGSVIDLSAPGSEIISLRAVNSDLNLMLSDSSSWNEKRFSGPHQNYYTTSGTSFATPFVSGAASLLFSLEPELEANQIKNKIVNSAIDIDVPGIDQNTGYGLLSVEKALKADPDYFIAANISSINVVQGIGGQPEIQVLGTAAANNLEKVAIEIGSGDEPKSFEPAFAGGKENIIEGIVGTFAATKLMKSKVWTLRLVVQHKNGTTRENRYRLQLG